MLYFYDHSDTHSELVTFVIDKTTLTATSTTNSLLLYTTKNC